MYMNRKVMNWETALLWERNHIVISNCGVRENDIRFKIRREKYVSMKILRRDLKTIKFRKNHKSVKNNPPSIRLYNNSYISIESYTFRITRIHSKEYTDNNIFLPNLTEKIVRKSLDSKKKQKRKKPVAQVQPNKPPLCKENERNENVILQNRIHETIDLTL